MSSLKKRDHGFILKSLFFSWEENEDHDEATIQDLSPSLYKYTHICGCVNCAYVKRMCIHMCTHAL